MLPINWNPGAQELRSFARLWFPLFVATIGGVLWWRFNLPTAAFWVWGIGAAVAAAVLADRRVTRAVFVGLLVVTYPIGFVVSTVALGLLFYLLFVPLGLGMRLARRDPLRLRTRHEASQWQPVKQDLDAQRMFRQF